jgi:hypothetical protein
VGGCEFDPELLIAEHFPFVLEIANTVLVQDNFAHG